MKIEIAYEIRDYVHFLIASQIKQNALSWNYRDVLNYLYKNLSIPPLKVVNKLFLAYQNFYEFKMCNLPYYNKTFIDEKQNDAISILDLTCIDKFHIAFEQYIKYISDSISPAALLLFKKEINKIFTKLENDTNRDQYLIDISYIIKLIYKFFEKRNIANKDDLEILYKGVCKRFDELVILNYNRETLSELNGLSIRYKNSKLNYLFGYEQWTRFLEMINKKFYI